jgi:hypothetical protein
MKVLKTLFVVVLFVAASVCGFYVIVLMVDSGNNIELVTGATIGVLLLSTALKAASIEWLSASNETALFVAFMPAVFALWIAAALWVFASNVLGVLIATMVLGLAIVYFVRKLARKNARVSVTK